MKNKIKIALIVSTLFCLIAPTFITEVLLSDNKTSESIQCDSPVSRDDIKYTKPRK